jgi:U3 small nucleolar RNA-associated protein 11
MLSAGKASQGKHGRGEETNRLSHDAVKLLKSQDAGYLRTVAGRGRRELERLEEVVGLEGALLGSGKTKAGRKMVFVDGEEGGDQGKRGQKRKVEEMNQEDAMDVMNSGANINNVHLDSLHDHDTDLASAATPANPKSKRKLQAEQQVKLDLRAARRRRKRLGELRAAKLEALKKRQKEIMAAAEQLELQRAKMSRTVGGVNKDGVKWKIRERKK